MKKLLVIVGVLALLAVAGAMLLLGNLGGIIKGIVEKVGSDATQATVTLNAVEFSVTDGSGELKELVVGNPEGFKSDHAMSLGLVRVKVDRSTLGSDTIVIKEVVIDAPQFIYEVSLSGTNIGAIQENVQAYAAALGGGGEKEPSGGEEPSGDSGDDGKKLIIENLYIRDARVAVSATFLGGKETGATLKEIHLTNLGKSEGGVSPGEIAAQVLSAITKAIVETVSEMDIEGLKKFTKKDLKRVLTEEGGILDKAGEGLKNLFGGDGK